MVGGLHLGVLGGGRGHLLGERKGGGLLPEEKNRVGGNSLGGEKAERPGTSLERQNSEKTTCIWREDERRKEGRQERSLFFILGE